MNTYLIEGENGILLFDTGWAGTFPSFCRALGEINIPVQSISLILISHFHPDHMGIAQEIADQGAVILIPYIQKDHIHDADSVFEKEELQRQHHSNAGDRADSNSTPARRNAGFFIPIKDESTRLFSLDESRAVLKEIGLEGQIFHTPGHSGDSISLLLDSGDLFVGDLNPLYELEMHTGTQIGRSWEILLSHDPKVVHYGHARTFVSGNGSNINSSFGNNDADNLKYYNLVSRIIKLIDKGCDIRKIQKKTGADPGFIEDVMRMYLTHQNVGVQGILDRIEIKNR